MSSANCLVLFEQAGVIGVFLRCLAQRAVIRSEKLKSTKNVALHFGESDAPQQAKSTT
jgi:hypothetical protein